MRLQIMEWCGAALLSVAAGIVAIPLGMAVLGLYLFGAAVVAQVFEGEVDDGE